VSARGAARERGGAARTAERARRDGRPEVVADLLTVVPARGAAFARRLALLEARGGRTDTTIEHTVRAIVDDVRRRGDAALFAYTRRFDGVALTARTVEVPRAAMERAAAALPRAVRRDLELAARRIRDFHRRQRQASWSYRDAAGALLGAANGFLARLALRAEVDFRVTSAGRLALMTTVALAVGALLGWIYTPFVLGGVGASQLLLAGAAAFTAVRTAQR